MNQVENKGSNNNWIMGKREWFYGKNGNKCKRYMASFDADCRWNRYEVIFG